MTDKQKTSAEAFYDLGVAMRRFSQAMSENWLAFVQGTHSVEKFTDQFTYKQRFALWILITAKRLADWVAGGEND